MFRLVGYRNELYQIEDTQSGVVKAFNEEEIDYLKSIGYIEGISNVGDGTRYKYKAGSELYGMRLKYYIVGSNGNWVCECLKCNNKFVAKPSTLRSGVRTLCPKCKRIRAKVAYKVGDVYGDYELIKPIESSNGKWICRCKKCGELKEKLVYSLSVGKGTICRKCNYLEKEKILKVGDIFGDYELIKYNRYRIWTCKCRYCGDIANKRDSHLKNGVGIICRKCHPLEIKSVKYSENDVFGDFRLTQYIPKEHGRWVCECIKCGYKKEVSAYDLKRNSGLNCQKCNKIEYRHKDLRDLKFGYLVPVNYKGNGIWECKCTNCNSNKLKEVSTSNLLNGSTKSCGCKVKPLIGSDTDRWHIIERVGNKYRCKCLNCGYEDTITYAFLNYKRCINCSTEKVSKAEQEIGKMFTGYAHNRRDILDGKEIDLYYEDEKVGIEYNGDYWHSEIYKDKYYHRDKTLECVKKGIRLIHIFEYEWRDSERKEKIIDLIGRALNKDKDTRVYARNTKVCEIGEIEAKEFLEENHLQGNIASYARVGLRYNDELVGLMTFGTPRFNNNYEYELLRMAYKRGIEVVGGSDKMLKYFIDKYDPQSIISYCDLSKFSGGVYTKIGFRLDGITEPNYVWVHYYKHNTLSRYQTQRKKLIEKYGLNESDSTLTEDGIMHRLGYVKVYDAGNARYIWEKES